MAKEDAPLPAVVPKKKRQLEALPAQHIAMWLSGSDITPSERKKLEAEKERRKQDARSDKKIVAIITDGSGVSPEQTDRLKELLAAIQLEAVFSRVPIKLKLDPGLFHSVHLDDQEMIKDADVVFCLPGQMQVPEQKYGAWAAAKYAKHRSTPVKVILRDGNEPHGEW